MTQIKASSILILFLGVGICADLIPWPGLGNGLIVTTTQQLVNRAEAEPVRSPEYQP